MDNSRPYLAYLPTRGVPLLFKHAKDFKSDLDPTINNWAQFFTNMKRVPFADKLQPKGKCIQMSSQFEESFTVRADVEQTVVSSIVKGIIDGLRPDTAVKVGNFTFACSGFVLSTYSNYFMMRRGQTEIDLTNTPVSKRVFDFIYRWLLNGVEYIFPKRLGKIIRGAYFLEMPVVLELCFTLLDGTRFKEIEAFRLIHRMREFQDLYCVSEAMSKRISSSTLMVMCSVQFLSLNDVQICQLLKSSFLAVNSETEIFFCTLHWLAHSWPDRRCHVLNVLKCIRYAYLSPKLLRLLNGSEFTRIGPFVPILREFKKYKEGRQKIEDGIFYSTLVITMNSDPSHTLNVPNANNDLIMPRRWMQDARCKYHRPVTRQCPNMRYVSYEHFLEYTETLLTNESDYEDYIQYPKDDEKRVFKFEMDFDLSSREAKMKDGSSAISSSSFTSTSKSSDISLLKDFKPPKKWKLWLGMAYRKENEDKN